MVRGSFQQVYAGSKARVCHPSCVHTCYIFCQLSYILGVRYNVERVWEAAVKKSLAERWSRWGVAAGVLVDCRTLLLLNPHNDYHPGVPRIWLGLSVTLRSPKSMVEMPPTQVSGRANGNVEIWRRPKPIRNGYVDLLVLWKVWPVVVLVRSYVAIWLQVPAKNFLPPATLELAEAIPATYEVKS